MPRLSRTLFALIASLTLAVTVVGFRAASPTVSSTTSATTERAEAGLYYSTTPDRANPQPLEGATLSGEVYIFAVSEEPLADGTFYLDGDKQRVENDRPYDFRGSTDSSGEQPRPWDTAGHEGRHVIEFDGSIVGQGGRYTTSASFAVETATSDPTPTDPTGPSPEPALFYSTTADRTDAQPLEGATLSGEVYVFARSEGRLVDGTFYLDGDKQRVENDPPYDFRGSSDSSGETARPWDTAGDEGRHVIEFDGPLSGGGEVSTSATFVVETATSDPRPTEDSSSSGGPPPTEEPTPAEEPAATEEPTATSDPTPTEPTPDDGARPGPDNTGVPKGTVLEPSGSITVTEPGTVLDRLDISGRVVVNAPNVVIRRSKIHGDGDGFGVRVMSGGNSVTIEDSEIYNFENGIVFSNWTARRVDLHSMVSDGVKLGDNATLEDSYLHHFNPPSWSHADGAQLESAGAENVVVRGNTIDLANPGVKSGYGGNSAIILKPDLGDLGAGGILVEDNYLNGGNYTFYLVNSEDRELRNVTVRDNRWGRVHRYGSTRVTTPVEWSNNVWDDTGRPVPR